MIIYEMERSFKQIASTWSAIRKRYSWMIERLFAWLQNFRWLVTRYEHSLEDFTGMLHLACALILLRHL